MTQGTSLSLSCRQGKVMAGYLYFPREGGDRVARSRQSDQGLVLDYAADGRLIGIEMPDPTPEAFEALLTLMRELDCADPERELMPLKRALAC